MRTILILLLLATPCQAGYRESHATTMCLLRQRTALLLKIQRHQESIIRSLEIQLGKGKGTRREAS